jgi:hypothetical protein
MSNGTHSGNQPEQSVPNKDQNMSNAAMSNSPSRLSSTFPTRVIAGVVLAFIGVAMSAWAYQFHRQGPLLTWGIFPGAPFVLLASLSLVKRVPLRVTIGAYVAGFLAIVLPYGAIWYESLNHNGGGANIGLGILTLAAIVLLPIPMLIGGFIGWLVPTDKKEPAEKVRS